VGRYRKDFQETSMSLRPAFAAACRAAAAHLIAARSAGDRPAAARPAAVRSSGAGSAAGRRTGRPAAAHGSRPGHGRSARWPDRAHRRLAGVPLAVLCLALPLVAGIAVGPTAAAEDTAPAAAVTIAGSLQSELGCPGDWQPECAQTRLVYDAEDDLWQATFVLPAGTYEYKAALDGSWTENYGAHAQRDGANVALTVPAAEPVTFRYSERSHWVADSESAVLATAVGTFQRELGCAADWAPDCLRSWLQDADGDGTYTFSTAGLRPGTYATRVALNSSLAGAFPGSNVDFTVGATSDTVTISYLAATHAVTATVRRTGSGLEPGDDRLAGNSLRGDLAGEKFYFVMPDRFANGDPRNDRGRLAGTRLDTGFDPTDKGFYHGGDLAGLTQRLGYLKGLGTTAIWLTPMFKNKPVQGAGAGVSAGYHGYWATDFTQIDPHFGSNSEMRAFIAAAHARGIKVFFDIVANHTADVITYAENQSGYRSKAAVPYVDATGREFDDRDFVNRPFPPLTRDSFPYTPVFRSAADTTVKKPAWLNDVTLYHNRGDTTFAGENALYGDFFGLDDLFTENPRVVAGMTGIFEFWIDQLGIDGYRVDTVKHVNLEFWQRLAPAVQAYAHSHGKPNFFVFGEVFDSDVTVPSVYSTKGRLQAVLDFPFQSVARGYAAGRAPTDLDTLMRNGDRFTDADSNAYSLPTFLGNHDMGRIGFMLGADDPAAAPAALLGRDELAHDLMYLSRGNPVVYYGDEQGFAGTGGDKDARQDMFATRTADYLTQPRIGSTATGATDSYDPNHPLYRHIAGLAGLTAANPALRDGAQVQRYAARGPGVYAFSRIRAGDNVEYLVALNNATTPQTAAVPTFTAGATFARLWPAPRTFARTDAATRLTVTVPPLSAVVFKAVRPVPAPAGPPGVTLTPPPAGSTVSGTVEVGASVTGGGFNQVTFAAKPAGASQWQPLGTDDNAPYRVFYDVSGLPKDSTVELKAVVKDSAGHLNADKISVVVGQEPPSAPPGSAAPRDYAVVHYHRADGNYAGWGLHVWGDVANPTDWASPLPFAGEDSYGRFAWVKLAPGASTVNFIVHNGDTKDPDGDRSFSPGPTPEVWLQSGDARVYPARATAQGYVTVHYRRPGGDYDGWGVYVFGGVDDSELTTWPATRPLTGTDAFGRFVNIKLKGDGSKVGFIIGNNGVKDTEPDRFVDPTTTSDGWVNQGQEKVYGSAGAGQDYAVIHYHRDDGNYAGWTIYHWTGSATPTPSWEASRGPDGIDGFGAFWLVPLLPGAPALNYIVHNGDTKDPGGDQLLDLANVGYEASFLSGAKDPSGKVSYLLPVLGGAGVDADLSKAKAQWLSAGTVVWKVEPAADHAYSLRYSPDADITVTDGVVHGGRTIRLAFDPAGLTAAEKARWPQLASYPAFRARPSDLPRVADAVRGQVVALDRAGDGALRAATGVQLPGVLDDLYAAAAKNVTLGLTADGTRSTIRVWAPTAQSAAVLLRRPGATTDQLLPMTRSDASGVWTVSGTGWRDATYLFRLRVFAPTTGHLETNDVTDPYSVALTTNSARSVVVDLAADPRLQPAGWRLVRAPRLAAPVDNSVYELHVRDFSIGDRTVPAGHRGGYLAFTDTGSAGMRHLTALARAGLTDVHLLPAFDVATVEERSDQQQTPACDLTAPPPDSDAQQACTSAVADTDGFNWGYDPWHYTTPEGSYATNPEGPSRTKEFRQMVAGLNKAGLRVVMDVVYNHSTAAGQDPKSVLDRVVPGYYQRLDESGVLATSTCCANTAPEHAMMGKLVVDSVVTWAKQYKVNGFRFDLMGHHPKQNLLDVRAALDQLTPAHDGVDGRSIYLYGEGWNFGEVADNARFPQATQANMAGTGIGTFNDRLRDAVRGGGPFDGDPRVQGFGSGLFTDPNGAAVNGTPAQQRAALLHAQDLVRVGLTGNLADFTFVNSAGATVRGSDVDYNGSPAGYTARPDDAITYVDAHDNETLYDALAYKLPQATSMADRVRMQQLSLSTVFLGQGVPFLQAGTDILRSKSLDRDSFNSGDWFNKLDWSYQTNNFGVGLPPKAVNESKWPFMGPRLADPALRPSSADTTRSAAVFRDWLKLRADSPLFRLGSADLVRQKLSFPASVAATPGVLVMRVDDTVGPDVDPRYAGLVVVFNATPSAQTLTLPELAGRSLRLSPVQAAGADPVVQTATVASGTLTVPARTTAVFVEPTG
jgi:pullulanase-type alpha-1,6-glucosidase